MAEYRVLRPNPKDLKGRCLVVVEGLYGDFGGRLATDLCIAFNKAHAIEMEGRKELEAFVLVIPGVY